MLPSVVALFYTLGSLLIPGLILPFLYSLKQDNQIMNKNIAVWMILPIIISGFWFILSKLMNQPLLRLEPFYPGMATSFLYYIVIKIKVNYGS